MRPYVDRDNGFISGIFRISAATICGVRWQESWARRFNASGKDASRNAVLGAGKSATIRQIRSVGPESPPKITVEAPSVTMYPYAATR